jgi:hypothetical protein
MATKFKACSVDGCKGNADRSARGANGWCGAHYQRWWRHGDPLSGRTPWGEPERYYREVVLPYDGAECLIWPYALSNGGYGLIGGKIVARLVCEDANGLPPTDDHEAAHSCGRGGEACVTKRHLSWKTHGENEADKLAHGTHNRGERHGLAKLTEPEVRQILALKGTKSQSEIAEQFGVVQQQVSRIHRKVDWNWLEE